MHSAVEGTLQLSRIEKREMCAFVHAKKMWNRRMSRHACLQLRLPPCLLPEAPQQACCPCSPYTFASSAGQAAPDDREQCAA